MSRAQGTEWGTVMARGGRCQTHLKAWLPPLLCSSLLYNPPVGPIFKLTFCLKLDRWSDTRATGPRQHRSSETGGKRDAESEMKCFVCQKPDSEAAECSSSDWALPGSSGEALLPNGQRKQGFLLLVQEVHLEFPAPGQPTASLHCSLSREEMRQPDSRSALSSPVPMRSRTSPLGEDNQPLQVSLTRRDLRCCT